MVIEPMETMPDHVHTTRLSVGHISEETVKKYIEKPVNQIKTYRFKLKPTDMQAQAFTQWLGTCRYVYNLCLEYKKQLYTDHSISIRKNDIQKELSAIAREVEWIGCVHSQTLQEVTDRLFKSYDSFFKRSKGFPKFTKRGQYRSFTYKQGVKLHQNTCRIQLPKIG